MNFLLFCEIRNGVTTINTGGSHDASHFEKIEEKICLSSMRSHRKFFTYLNILFDAIEKYYHTLISICNRMENVITVLEVCQYEFLQTYFNYQRFLLLMLFITHNQYFSSIKSFFDDNSFLNIIKCNHISKLFQFLVVRFEKNISSF